MVGGAGVVSKSAHILNMPWRVTHVASCLEAATFGLEVV